MAIKVLVSFWPNQQLKLDLDYSRKLLVPCFFTMPEKAVTDIHNAGHFLESYLIQQICLGVNEAWRFRWNCLIQEHVILSLIRRIKSLVLLFPRFQSQFVFWVFCLFVFLADNWQKWGVKLLIHNRRHHVFTQSTLCVLNDGLNEDGPREVTFRYIIIMKITGLGSVEQNYARDPFLFEI